MAVDGRLRSLEGDYPGAIAALEKALPRLEYVGDEDWQTWARYGHAEAHGLAGDAEAELASLEATLRWQAQRWPADHAQLVPTRLRRLVALHLAQQHATAVVEAQSLLVDVQRIFGEDTAEAAYVYNTLGRSLESMDRPAEALDAYRHAHASSSRAVGRDHPNTLRMQFNLAYNLESANATAEAGQAYEELLRLASQRLGPDNAILAYYRMHAAAFLHAQGQAEAAMRALAAPDWQLAYAKLSATNQTEYRERLDALCKAASELAAACAAMQRELSAQP
jgi:tetratricopeptide (TPR) repeat protein